MKQSSQMIICLFIILLNVNFTFAQISDQRNLELVVQTGHSGAVESMAFSQNGKLLASGDKNGVIKLWDLSSGREIKTLSKHSLGVSDISFSPSGNLLVSGGTDSSIKIWNVIDGRELMNLYGGSHSIISVIFSADEKKLISASLAGGIKLWDVATGKELKTFKGHTDYILSMTLSPDGETLATGSKDETIRLWSIKTGKLLKTISGQSGGIGSLSFNSDGRILASGGYYENFIKLWDVKTARLIKTFQDSTEYGVDVKFSPVENIFTTRNIEYGIKIWNAETGKVIKNLATGNANVISSVFSPNGEIIASGHLYDKSIKLWDVKTGGKLNSFEGVASLINSITFSQDETTLAFIDEYTKITTWNLTVISKLKSFNKYESTARQELEQTFPRLFDILDLDFGFPIKAYYKTAESKNLIAEISSNTANVKLFDKETKKELATIIPINNDWAIIAPDGRFDASESALKLMHYSYGLEIINLDQLKEMYYEPGLLQKILGFSKEPLRPVVPLNEIKLYPEIVEQKFDEKSEKLIVRLKNRGGGIGETRVLVNDKMVVADARDEKLKKNPLVADGAIVTLTADLKGASFLKGRENSIKVITSNFLREIGKGNIQSRGSEIIHLDSEKEELKLPTLYTIVGGVSDYDGEQIDLRFAAKDAEDFSHALSLGARRLFCDKSNLNCTDKVQITTLSTNRPNAEEQPTKENFKKAFADVAAKAKAEDIIVIYLAGHGVSLGAGTDSYFYLTKESRSASKEDLAKVYQTAAISSTELTEWLTTTEWQTGEKGMKALKQVLILDTCAAGTAAGQLALTAKRDLSGDQIRAIEFLKDKTGTFVLMGSTADAPSYEASQFGQGLLTYSLLQAMQGADLDRGEYVDVRKLFTFAEQNVPKMAVNIGGVQKPIVSAPLGKTFVIGQMTNADKQKIILPTQKPIILRPQLGVLPRNNDPLNLNAALRKGLDAESSYEFVKQKGDKAPLWIYVDDDSLPNGIQISGTYKIDGEIIKVKIYLFKGDKEIAESDEISASKNEINEKLLESIRRELVNLN